MSADDNSRIANLRTKLTELESEIQDIERKLQGGEFRGDEGQIKLNSQLWSLKTKLTELRNEGANLESEARELLSETRGVLSEMRGVVTKLQSEFLAFWDVELKATNYLMIAHAAGLVTCVTLLKDYKDNAQLKGIGLFVSLFGYGLTTAIIAFILLLTQRTLFLDTDVKQLRKFLKETKWVTAVCFISCAFLIVAITVAIWKFSSL
jgi:hypothetical protein